MTVAGNGSRRYEIHCSSAIAEEIREVHRQAANQGRGKEVTEAFRQIIQRLEIDPFDVGEAAYRLPGLRLQVRSTIVRPLVVDFGVSEDRPLVFIKGVKLLSAK